ncbi:flavin reductase family protein [Algoriphagus boritolerans]|uniref:NADH-FMN oxidoreductase RutF, flavin reductase (DIM6/NTAB) family n=1 Tax=Algoriphagus boritolerans DSM 17298 = JCM 18970 TaxID=1120964 RepID=A0A1H5WMD7_9BACT|nr:flavin reductase [Algoriphagus boritolerans]SEG00406.1 NADH-FMN oxidoreductase RutF, flavin reductase (DIM6/NTAB) family [Algoriphagus boritolerans DSM 17298 = JCM 18970]
MTKRISSEEIMSSDSFYRRNLINCLSGYKSLNLIGTQDSAGITNLALFSQVFHIGANPPMVGILFRPNTVIRHTLDNIMETGFFTMNHVTSEFYKEAHWTSARWEESEFEATGIAPEFLDGFKAPFVRDSPVRLACSLLETQTLKVNQTILLIGSIDSIYIDERGLRADGSLDLGSLGTVTVAGLDDYFVGKRLGRLSYAKSDKMPEEI